MTNSNSNNVTHINEALGKKRAADLYEAHDAFEANTAGSLRTDIYTSGGASIIDDVEFFLGHDELSGPFEHIFRQHLKDFSELVMKKTPR